MSAYAPDEPKVTISQEVVPSPARSLAKKTAWSSLNPISQLAHAPGQTPAEAFTRKIIFEPPWWITVWFAGSSVLVIWDFTYCFFRPHSFEHWIWRPYQLYATIDYIYSRSAFESGNGFTNAQSFLNVIETMLNIEYLYLAHSASTKQVPGREARGHATAPLIGFAAAIMTLSKTLLYHLQEYYCGGCMVGHNDLSTLFWLWIIPNGAWIVMPFFVMCTLGGAIASALRRDAATAVHELEGMRAAAGPSAEPSAGPSAVHPASIAPTPAIDLTPTQPIATSSALQSEVRQLRSRDVSMTPSRTARGESVASSVDVGSGGEGDSLARTRQTPRKGRSSRLA